MFSQDKEVTPCEPPALNASKTPESLVIPLVMTQRKQNETVSALKQSFTEPKVTL